MVALADTFLDDLPAELRTSYLGFGLLVKERTVTVYTPDGRFIAKVRAMSTARRVVRAYRKTS